MIVQFKFLLLVFNSKQLPDLSFLKNFSSCWKGDNESKAIMVALAYLWHVEFTKWRTPRAMHAHVHCVLRALHAYFLACPSALHAHAPYTPYVTCKVPWPPNLVGRWRKIRCHNPQNHLILWSLGHVTN